MPPHQPHFDSIARPYRWLEYLTFGPNLQRCRNFFVPQILQSRRALVLGDGDGRFLSRLLRSNQHLHAEAVDLSPAMLKLLERRARTAQPPTSTRLTTYLADARTFTPNGPYDLVVTHFFLDCLTQSELDQLALRLVPRLTITGLWLLSDFQIPPAGALRLPARLLIRLLYLAFRLLTGLRTTRLPDHAASLRRAGLVPVHVQRSLFGVLTTELWQRHP